MSQGTTRIQRDRPPPPPRRPCIEIVSGARAGQRLALEPGPNRIGREASLELCLDEEGVSRRHAEIFVDEYEVVTLTDLDSTNGTFVNDGPITRTALREGDRIRVGEVELRFGLRTAEELRQKSALVTPFPTPDSPLTKREREVARLVAEGYSNDGVAAHLDISSRTVGKHLSNVYQKLRIHTRAELTRWVLTAGEEG